MTPITSERDLFLQHLRQSGLLTGAQLRQVPSLPRQAEALELARAMIRDGLLTRFQARMLLRGRTDGFFLGPYRILELVGNGGMGRVYKALHEPMKRVVALKVLSTGLVNTEKAREFFRHEAQTAAQLDHRNIVRAYDASEVDGRYYLAMEFIAGKTLRQVVQERGALPIGIACEVIRQAALGLQHAHAKGLVHRDIKPANLMMSLVAAEGEERELRVTILDFGLAQLQGRDRSDEDGDAARHPITGTPDFMSPEQARDRNAVDIRSDLYSLGCTFYYLLTGRPPFAGGNLLDKLIRHQSELPRAPEKIRPAVPPAVAAIVLKLLAKDADDRFQTPQELAEALTPLASVRPFARRRAARRRPASPTEAQAADKTLGVGRDDTSPNICLPDAVRAEQEAVSSWVEVCRGDQRRFRRRLFGIGGTIAGLAAAASAVAALLQLG